MENIERPALPEIATQKVDMCATYLILACIDSGAGTMTLTKEGFSKDGYVFGDYKVTVEKL